ncbi:MAG: type III pantothenate kinase [Candidatus Omnitrophica bacterium]|nr:type III pantothenate kinase [Candidatus Omnitrophota bacterium]MCF7877493.1 type III pantothenate kinase [Candidatus Omnitrophota bacterium]MCF7878317.1 type III pantothenate kinase [Candidatus Omnitrophota bacterium]MCF7892782.1 type III pantothenate kinase [Candidatus Omnitrophota bacterium]
MIGIDIGNTAIKLGVFNKNKLTEVYFLDKKEASAKSIKNLLSKINKRHPILICSVVPKINRLFFKLKRDIYFVEKDIKIPIKCFYDKSKVGPDRLLAAYAAKKIEDSVRLILDFGTAITLDFLSKKGDYQGGIILPGISSTLTTFKRCALLPDRIEIKAIRKIVPQNTFESINKGLQDGFSIMINGLIAKYRQKLKLSKSDKILITGGDFSLLKSRFEFDFRYKKHLVLQGLFYLYQDFFGDDL